MQRYVIDQEVDFPVARSLSWEKDSTSVKITLINLEKKSLNRSLEGAITHLKKKSLNLITEVVFANSLEVEVEKDRIQLTQFPENSSWLLPFEDEN